MISERTRARLAELQARGIKLGLDKVHRLLARLDDPQQSYRAVQIAGTNGKGSVVYGLEAIARRRGIRTGAFTSPHLVDPTERIRIDGVPLEGAEFDARVERLSRRLARWAVDDPELARVTYFEFGLGLALEAFRDHGVERALLEVGLGGRLDATTAAPVELTCITSIALDHQAFLGDDLASIAREKAGIARPGVPLLIGPLPAEAGAAIRAAAARVGAPVEEVAPIAGIHNGMWGDHQRINAALAWRLAERWGLSPADAEAEALARVQVPGRCERIEGVPELLLDGAHNPAGAQALAAALAQHPAAGATDLLLSVGRDKDAAGIVAPLLPLARRVAVTAYREGRGPSPASVLAAEVVRHGVAVEPFEDADTAFEALRAGAEDGDRLVVAGSLFLVGQIRARPDVRGSR